MQQVRQYLRLARINKLQGALLLWCPTAYALWISSKGHPSIKMVILFLMGVFCMRSAGCVMNDVADRQIDKYVERTASRPLAAGSLSLIQALALLTFFLVAALLILLQLPSACFPYALLALLLAGCYPFAKRYIQAPQLVLGVAFSMGIPIVYIAVNKACDLSCLGLFCINFLWIVMYDTQYALSDYSDDLKLKVHSTAIFLHPFDLIAISILQLVVQAGWAIGGIIAHWGFIFWVMWGLAGCVFMYQQRLLRIDKHRYAFSVFQSNCWYGIALWIGIIGATYSL